jgi:hypothetical protein
MGYMDDDDYFVVVKICRHKGKVYDPANCIETSRTIMTSIKAGKQKVIKYVL